MAAEHGSSAKVHNLGWPDAFIEHGNISELRHKYNLDEEGIAKTIKEFAGGLL